MQARNTSRRKYATETCDVKLVLVNGEHDLGSGGIQAQAQRITGRRQASEVQCGAILAMEHFGTHSTNTCSAINIAGSRSVAETNFNTVGTLLDCEIRSNFKRTELQGRTVHAFVNFTTSLVQVYTGLDIGGLDFRCLNPKNDRSRGLSEFQIARDRETLEVKVVEAL
ncbi:hypothetical protein D3C72_230260 [compost metagenome]